MPFARSVMKPELTRRLFVFLVAALLAGSLQAADGNNVAIASGKPRGVQEGEPTVFRGVPFAAPPVGELRWRAPQPPTPWSEVRAADSFGPACPQAPRADRPGVLGEVSEDCLTLNLWVPPSDPESPLPVMVWIHGGAFVVGSSSWPWYDGSELARRGVLVVTVNYRLGRLGFFAHPALSELHGGSEPLGNYGLMDQIAALEWVQQNIAAFGGDPDNVTVFGESAGGASVLHLLTIDASRGLFHKAISQSGGGHGPSRHISRARPGTGLRTAESAEALGARFATQQGIEATASSATTAAALRALPLEIMVPNQALGVRVSPLIDGKLVVDDVSRRLSNGERHDVPLLIGANSFEGSLARVLGVGEGMIERLLGRWATEARELYDADSDPIWPLRVYGDSAFVAPARWIARQSQGITTPTFLYHFSYVATATRDSAPGAAHGADVPFVFSTLDRLPGASDEDRRMASAMSDYWASFAKSGIPSSAGHPEWPAYKGEEDALLEFGTEIRVRAGLLSDRLDLFDRRFLGLEERWD